MSAFDKVLREAREDLGVEQTRSVDWDAIDKGLFERITEERRVERARFASRGFRRWPEVVLAAAGAVVVFALAAREGKRERTLDVASAGDEIAGSILSIEGDGQARVDGALAVHGLLLRNGDVIEARGAQVTVERPGKLTLRVESGSRVTVTHTRGTLVLALAQGAVEAQVVPVASGEAFAVDVDGSRVAVHGTHLRVARDGQHVSVDLNEGVVSVGQAPRIGSMLGTLVTAPGHAEFVATNAVETLSVTHDLAAVRSPVGLGTTSQGRSAALVLPPAAATKSELSAPLRSPAPTAITASHGDAHPGAGGVAADANPDHAIATAVRSCMAERPRVENVTVVVRTTLRLELEDDGTVRAARFDPPVAPDVNACAVTSIYKVRFAHGGTEAISIDFEN
jgi:hypothetical protein